MSAFRAHWRWWLLFAAFGHLSLGSQVYLLREYMVALAGNETAVGIGLFAWLIGISAGAFVAKAVPKPRASVVCTASMIALAVSAYLEVLLARIGTHWLGVPLGELSFLGSALKLAFAVFALPSVFTGVSFVTFAMLALPIEPRSSRTMGTLYAFESLGSLTAGVLTSLVLFTHVRPLLGLTILIVLGLAGTLPAAFSGLIAYRFPLMLTGALAFVLAVTPVAEHLEQVTQEARFRSLSPRARLREWQDTPYQYLAASTTDSCDLYVNGRYVRSYPDEVEDELLAHRLLLLNPEPRRVLVLSGVDASLLRFGVKHPVTTLDWVVLDRRQFEFTRSLLNPEDRSVLSDSRVHVRFADPRSFLRTEASSYDLILLLEPEPSTLLLARETTVQFFRAVASRLAPSGTFVTRIVTGPNVQLGETAQLGVVLYRTLKEVFGLVVAAPGPDGLLIAGNTPDSVSLDVAHLANRWQSRAIESNVFSPELLTEYYPPERVSALNREVRKAAPEATPATDNHPLAYSYALVLRQRLAQDPWTSLLKSGMLHPGAIGLLPVIPCVLVLVWLARCRRPNVNARRMTTIHSTLVGGFVAMGLNIMLIISFQTRVGALYSQLGLLGALFMLGLTLGGLWASMSHHSLMAPVLASLLCAGLVTLTFVVLQHAEPSVWISAFLHGLLLVSTGAATGAIFPLAVDQLRRGGHDAQGSASLTQAADHLGGAVAALLVPVLFIPTLGLVSFGLLLCAILSLTLVTFWVSSGASAEVPVQSKNH